MPQYRFKQFPSLTAFVLLVSCGQPQNESELQIVGGSAVSADSSVSASTVALVNPQGKIFCTGTLITRQHVVTAGHCLAGYKDKMLFVAFGPKAKVGHFAKERLRSVSKAKVHEDFDLAHARKQPVEAPINDIALMKLSAPAPAAYQPAKVLSAKSQLKEGESLLLAGYGKKHFLDRDIGDLYQTVTKVFRLNGTAKEFDFGPANGRSACSGDSGGPAFVLRGKELALAGVTSRGDALCMSTGTYTDIRRFLGWLQQSIQQQAKP